MNLDCLTLPNIGVFIAIFGGGITGIYYGWKLITEIKEKNKKPTLKIDFMKIQPRPDDLKFEWQQIFIKNTCSVPITLTGIYSHYPGRGEKPWKKFPIFGSGGKTGPFTQFTLRPNSRRNEDIWLYRPLLLDINTDWIAIKDSNGNEYFIPQKEYLFLDFYKKYRLYEKNLPQEYKSFFEFVASDNIEKNYCRFN